MLSWTAAQVANVSQAFVDHGMFDNTLIIFLSDNGGPCHASGTCPQKPQPECAGCNLPLQGYKHSLYEGGIRTAAFVSGSGVGVVSNPSSTSPPSLASLSPPTPPTLRLPSRSWVHHCTNMVTLT